MGVTRHQDVLLRVGTFNHDVEHSFKTRLNVIDLVEQPEAHVGSDLVISGTASVQLSAQRTNELSEPALVCCVDVLVILRWDELEAREPTRCRNGCRGVSYHAIRPFLPDELQTFNHLDLFCGCEDSDFRQALRVRDGSTNISIVHPLVVLERLVERVHPVPRLAMVALIGKQDVQRISLASEATAP